jgi:hypothetical protein
VVGLTLRAGCLTGVGPVHSVHEEGRDGWTGFGVGHVQKKLHLVQGRPPMSIDRQAERHVTATRATTNAQGINNVLMCYNHNVLMCYNHMNGITKIRPLVIGTKREVQSSFRNMWYTTDKRLPSNTQGYRLTCPHR